MMAGRVDSNVTAGALWRWLRAYGYEVVVAQTVDGRRVAWAVQPPDRPPLPDAVRHLIVRHRYDLAAVADEHFVPHCSRLQVLAYSRAILQAVGAR